jgi:hypothetical protein
MSDPSSGPPKWARIVLSLLVVFHGVASVGSVLNETPVGDTIRVVTRPWEKRLGVHQTWPMFGSPPRGTTTLRFIGRRGDGSEVELDVLPGEPDPNGVIWMYERGAKLERNASETKRDYLRGSLFRYACRTNDGVDRVRIERVTRRSPKPGSTDVGPRDTWKVSSEKLHDWKCR